MLSLARMTCSNLLRYTYSLRNACVTYNAGNLQRQHSSSSRRKSLSSTDSFAAAVAALDKSSSSSSAKGTSKVTRLQEALPCTVTALFQQLLADDARYGMVPFHTAQVCIMCIHMLSID
jgi:hypothetical protein